MNRPLIAGIIAAGALLAACSADETEFKETAEKLISSEWKKLRDEDLTDVKCDDPPATSVGTTFDCFATGPDGTAYSFTATIPKENEVAITQNAG